MLKSELHEAIFQSDLELLKKDPIIWNRYIKSLYFNIFSTFFSITVGDGTR